MKVSYFEMFKAHQSLSLCLITMIIFYVLGIFEQSKASKMWVNENQILYISGM